MIGLYNMYSRAAKFEFRIECMHPGMRRGWPSPGRVAPDVRRLFDIQPFTSASATTLPTALPDLL